ncbi:MAG: sulfatase activating formylglycine-generating enzyme [Salibacteraceae bacterium]|jgi:formylglycine-generating enzyme required for sulfatase activity
MKTSLLITVLFVVAILMSFTAEKKPSSKQAKKSLNGFCNYVPSGSIVIDSDTTTVQAFYMSTTEVTNLQYKEFLIDLKMKGELEKLQIANIDSTLWNTSFGWENNGFKDYYHNHPAYHDYPVVNITKEAAELYCEWLTEKYRVASGGELSLKFRIPTRAEWMRAARGNDHSSIYSWEGPFLRNDKGLVLANHLQIGTQNLTRNLETGEIEFVDKSHRIYGSSSEDGADVTAPARSYWPNQYGFYNMNGNVSEMISDGDQAVGGDWYSPGFDIRNESVKEFKEAHPTVGFRVVTSHLVTTEH